MVAAESIGKYCERHSQHCGPSAAHQGIAYSQYILIGDKVYGDKTYCAD